MTQEKTLKVTHICTHTPTDRECPAAPSPRATMEGSARGPSSVPAALYARVLPHWVLRLGSCCPGTLQVRSPGPALGSTCAEPSPALWGGAPLGPGPTLPVNLVLQLRLCSLPRPCHVPTVQTPFLPKELTQGAETRLSWILRKQGKQGRGGDDPANTTLGQPLVGPTVGVLLSRCRDLGAGRSPVAAGDHCGHSNLVLRFRDIAAQGQSQFPPSE